MPKNQLFEPTMSEDDYNRGQITQQFLDETIAAQHEVTSDDGHAFVKQDETGVTISTGKNTSGYGIKDSPTARGNQVVRELSEVPGSGLDYNAAQEVEKMHYHANMVNKAHDAVTSGGRDTNIAQESKEDLERKLAGNNSVGGIQELGSMARSAGRKYDIKGGVAVRGEIVEGDKIDDRSYEPFPAHLQEKAKAAIRSRGEQQGLARAEQQRLNEVRAAKDVLNRDGVRIPNEPENPTPQPSQPTDPTEPFGLDRSA